MARWLLPLGCMFLCPVMMGALLWALTRDREKAKLEREVGRINRRAALLAGEAAPRRLSSDRLKKLWCSACLNWRVLLALAAAAIAMLALRPRLLFTAGPGLLLLACPLSMGLAMLAMSRRGARNESPGRQPSSTSDTGAATRVEPPVASGSSAAALQLVDAANGGQSTQRSGQSPVPSTVPSALTSSPAVSLRLTEWSASEGAQVSTIVFRS